MKIELSDYYKEKGFKSAYLVVNKGHREERRVEMTCPICGKKFQFLKRNLSTHPNPCCSRKCGGIKSREKFKKKTE